MGKSSTGSLAAALEEEAMASRWVGRVEPGCALCRIGRVSDEGTWCFGSELGKCEDVIEEIPESILC